MLDTIHKNWGWLGIKPVRLVASNDFGNIIFQSSDGTFWRICPEELVCNQIAANLDEYEALRNDSEFIFDWEMENLVQTAREVVGLIDEHTCYCLVIPGVLGGEYEPDNLSTISRLELIAFAGDVAEQIKDLPDGAQVQFKFVQ